MTALLIVLTLIWVGAATLLWVVITTIMQLLGGRRESPGQLAMLYIFLLFWPIAGLVFLVSRAPDLYRKWRYSQW